MTKFVEGWCQETVPLTYGVSFQLFHILVWARTDSAGTNETMLEEMLGSFCISLVGLLLVSQSGFLTKEDADLCGLSFERGIVAQQLMVNAIRAQRCPAL